MERELEGLRDGAEGTGEFAVRGAGVGGLDRVDAAVEGRMVVGDFAHDLDALSEGDDLGALSGPESADEGFGFALGLVEAVPGAHAERIVDGDDGDFAGALQAAATLRWM